MSWDVTKEVNKINDRNLTGEIGSKAITFLANNNKIGSNDLQNLQVQFAYLYQRDDGVLEGLFKIMLRDGRWFPMALQDGKLLLLTLDETKYNATVEMMMESHPCIRVNNNSHIETPIQAMRKQKNNNFLRSLNITTTELKCLYDDYQVQMKSLDEICKRALASFIAIQLSCDIREGKYAESRMFFFPMIDKFGLTSAFNLKELNAINNQCSEQDIIDLDWAYEALWSLLWCLGLVNDISDASQLCDCNYVMGLVMDAYKNPEKVSFFKKKTSFETFRDKCHLRSLEEILNMEDLYFRYHWAIHEKKVNLNASIGNLNSSNVLERRRGLEWVLSNEEDWYNVNLTT